MAIQIGMSCDPQWLCDGIGWVLALLLLLLLSGLLKVIIREIRQSQSSRAQSSREGYKKPPAEKDINRQRHR